MFVSATRRVAAMDRRSVLAELIRESHYVVDEAAVAEAIVVRAMARRLVPGVSLRSGADVPRVRSFRRHRGARSFTLARAQFT